MSRRASLIVSTLICACGGAEAETTAWDPTSEASGPGDTSASIATSDTAASSDETTETPTSASVSTTDPTDADASSSTGYDCTPWMTTWIGGPCESDGDCSYDGGLCLHEDEGFPCGTCSQPCEGLCPDLDGAPETFCIDGADVGIDATGHCLSQCSPALLGGNGCRDGYDCAALSRWLEPGTSTGVCVPNGMFDPMTACQQTLVDRGVAFVPTTHELDHPVDNPELDCVIIDPVLLYSPVLDVTLRDGGGGTNEVLVACETALAIADSAELATQMDPAATEIIHFGTYSCRVIAGTNTLSNHAEGRAIDMGGFVLEGGQELSLYFDWEDGVASPVTFEGAWLRDYADSLWDTMTWHIILTPEYNAAHDDHFHVDLTPGEMFYE